MVRDVEDDDQREHGYECAEDGDESPEARRCFESTHDAGDMVSCAQRDSDHSVFRWHAMAPEMLGSGYPTVGSSGHLEGASHQLDDAGG